MEKKQFPVSWMMCATCAISIENILKKTSWVKNVSVNYANQKANIEWKKYFKRRFKKNSKTSRLWLRNKLFD